MAGNSFSVFFYSLLLFFHFFAAFWFLILPSAVFAVCASPPSSLHGYTPLGRTISTCSSFSFSIPTFSNSNFYLSGSSSTFFFLFRPVRCLFFCTKQKSTELHKLEKRGAARGVRCCRWCRNENGKKTRCGRRRRKMSYRMKIELALDSYSTLVRLERRNGSGSSACRSFLLWRLWWCCMYTFSSFFLLFTVHMYRIFMYYFCSSIHTRAAAAATEMKRRKFQFIYSRKLTIWKFICLLFRIFFLSSCLEIGNEMPHITFDDGER